MKRIIAFALAGLIVAMVCVALCSCGKRQTAALAQQQASPGISVQGASETASPAQSPQAAQGNPAAYGNTLSISDGGSAVLTVEAREFTASLSAQEGSSISLELKDARFTGTVNQAGTAFSAALSMDADSVWELTADSYLTAFCNEDSELKNIDSNGFDIYYDVAGSENSWLGGVTVPLEGGGSLVPYSAGA